MPLKRSVPGDRAEFARLLTDEATAGKLPARAHGARERDISFPVGRKNKKRGGGVEEGGVGRGILTNNKARFTEGGSSARRLSQWEFD